MNDTQAAEYAASLVRMRERAPQRIADLCERFGPLPPLRTPRKTAPARVAQTPTLRAPTAPRRLSYADIIEAEAHGTGHARAGGEWEVFLRSYLA